MENLKKYLPWALRILISFLFLISAVAKMYPSPYFAISTFEVKQLYPMGFSEDFAVFFSRILIGIEFALGLLLLQPHFLKRIVIPATLLMLIVFTTHLTIDTIQNGGNSGNCGCFGSLLPMTPIEAIIKNVIAGVLLVYLLYLLPKNTDKKNFWVLTTVTFASILMIFMLAPIQPKAVEDTADDATVLPIETLEAFPAQPADSSAVPATETKTAETTAVEAAKPATDEPAPQKSGYAQYFSKADQGKKIICLFVPGCDHCRDVAKELTEMRAKNKNFPEVSVLFMNEEAEKIPEFFKFAGADYPYKVLEVIPFWKLLGTSKDTPGVIYLWNGNKIKEWDGINEKKFVGSELQNVLKKNYSELKK
ncbi:putative membrane protein YphA (DoxX/SURF4 family) [Flavobacterium gossypii]|uniref:Membrane protein YphA (DoxX/SURF4 family) n=1 Tax=Flavobacterium gossypii TaxID=1646119 RepID=A0ABR6DR49_9FLAO|nr:MauE/DoxX family redox-associated membrane protein [Flavobacterium gossypii]MBA9074171.1 putative membrane protein YphA (DoxX/SURF4 family) [Flavobacterium gossypii]